MTRPGLGGVLAILTAACATPDAHRTDLTCRDLAGVTHRPLAVTDAQAHVLLFVTTDCPIANAYAPTIRRLADEFSPRGVRFFLIHVDPDVGPTQARQHADDYDLPDPIVLDPEHRLVERLGPAVTPEAVVLDQTGTPVYQGRIDNRWSDLGRKRPHATRHDLAEALRAVLSSEAVTSPRTQAVGCAIPSQP